MALTTALISYWELGEASGTRNDSHGTNHLTDNNTVLSATGKVGNCADFEEANSEYLNRADNASLSTGDVDFTIACWVNLESKNPADNTLVGKISGSDGEYWLIHKNAADRFQFYVAATGGFGGQNGVSADNLGAPSLGQWYFIVAWHDAGGNTINIQVNNGTPDSVAHTTGVFDGTCDFYIGAGYPGPGCFHDGLIDQVGFWKSAAGAGGVLSSTDRTALYNSNNGLSYAALSGGGGTLIPVNLPADSLAGGELV